MKIIHLLVFAILVTSCSETVDNTGEQNMKEIPCTHLDPAVYPEFDEEAEAWFRQAYEMAQPKGEPIDFAEVARLYQKAAEKGHWKAINNLAVLHLSGLGVKQDEYKTVELYRRIAALGIPDGHMAIGLSTDEGLAGLKGAREKAIEYYVIAAKQGHPKAQTVVAKYLSRNGYRNKEGEQALRLLECAVEQDYGEAAYELASYYKIVAKDLSKTVYYYRRGAQLGQKNCLNQLKKAYRFGELGLNEDMNRARCLLQIKKELNKDPSLKFPDLDERCPGNVEQPY